MDWRMSFIQLPLSIILDNYLSSYHMVWQPNAITFSLRESLSLIQVFWSQKSSFCGMDTNLEVFSITAQLLPATQLLSESLQLEKTLVFQSWLMRALTYSKTLRSLLTCTLKPISIWLESRRLKIRKISDQNL